MRRNFSAKERQPPGKSNLYIEISVWRGEISVRRRDSLQENLIPILKFQYGGGSLQAN
jgi:hypothetical protein